MCKVVANLLLVWRSRCRRRRRLCFSFLVILSKFVSCVTPARIAKRSLVLLWSYIFYWFGIHSSQPNSKAGRGETKQQPQTWPACYTGRFRHRWISKAEVSLGRVFFFFSLPTTVAREGVGAWGPSSITSKPFILRPPKVHTIMYSSFLIILILLNLLTETTFPSSRHKAKKYVSCKDSDKIKEVG